MLLISSWLWMQRHLQENFTSYCKKYSFTFDMQMQQKQIYVTCREKPVPWRSLLQDIGQTLVTLPPHLGQIYASVQTFLLHSWSAIYQQGNKSLHADSQNITEIENVCLNIKIWVLLFKWRWKQILNFSKCFQGCLSGTWKMVTLKHKITWLIQIFISVTLISALVVLLLINRVATVPS